MAGTVKLVLVVMGIGLSATPLGSNKMIDYSKYSTSELKELASNLLKNGLTEEALTVEYELELRKPEKEIQIEKRSPNKIANEYGESIYRKKLKVQIIISAIVALLFSLAIFIGSKYGIRLEFLFDIYFGIGFLLIIFVPQYIVGKKFIPRTKSLHDLWGIIDFFGFRRLKQQFRIKHRKLDDMIYKLTANEEQFIKNMIDRYLLNVLLHFIISVILFVIWKKIAA